MKPGARSHPLGHDNPSGFLRDRGRTASRAITPRAIPPLACPRFLPSPGSLSRKRIPCLASGGIPTREPFHFGWGLESITQSDLRPFLVAGTRRVSVFPFGSMALPNPSRGDRAGARPHSGADPRFRVAGRFAIISGARRDPYLDSAASLKGRAPLRRPRPASIVRLGSGPQGETSGGSGLGMRWIEGFVALASSFIHFFTVWPGLGRAPPPKVTAPGRRSSRPRKARILAGPRSPHATGD